MTENEALDSLNNLHYKILHTSFCNKVYESEIEALCMAKVALKGIQRYRAIGTVEEFKALKEKSVAKKPIYSDFDDNDNDEIIPYKAICPVCGHEFNFGSWNDEENHHCICGQAIDWQ